jgi:CHAT domain-containing protein
MGRPEEALDEALQAEDIIRNAIRITSRGLAERQALRYAASRTTGLDVAFTLAAGGLPAPQRREIWDSLIRSRAQVFDEMASRHRKVGETSDPDVARLAERLSAARVRLANLVVGGPGSEGATEHARILEKAREEAERDERDMAAKSAEFRTEQEQGASGFAEVETSLPPGTALVAYTRYVPIKTARDKPKAERTAKPGKMMPREKTAAYAAWILRSGDPDPAFVPLGPAPAIEALVEAWRKEAAEDPPPAPEAGRRAEQRYRETALRLRKAVWDPIADRLAGDGQVFVVPDDVLNLISLATLPEGKDRYLLETGPEIHYLSAERDLVRPARQRQKGSGLLVLGDPDFDGLPRPLPEGPAIAKAAGPPVAQAERVSQSASEPDSAAGSGAYRGETAQCDRFRSTRWDPLPASRREAEQVAILWRRARAKGPEGAAVLKLIGVQAAEATVKRYASDAQVVHLATHAFVLQDRCPSALTAGTARSRDGFAAGLALPPLVGDNPLLLSGLVLAGANRKAPPADPRGGEDGVLTAEEIGSLDLSGVQWVVLSACETGVGRVQAGEGILGLRRAFQIAGAGSLIMTLWRVKDDPAREWVNELYKARLAGASTSRAVRQAALAALAARRRAGRPTHPFTWGAFVAAGDWR